MTLGIVIATEYTPNPLTFHFIISEEQAQKQVEIGSFLQLENPNGTITLGIVQNIVRTNKYYSSPDVVHGTASGLAPPQVYPSNRWDYLIAEGKALGIFKDGIQQRATQPVLPGSVVDLADLSILRKFLGIQSNGLNLGTLKQMDVQAHINMDKLLQKHLAILSISGGGKSYATSVIIEELLKRKQREGRPALIMFDAHGEFGGLQSIEQQFPNVEVEIIDASSVQIAVGHLTTYHFAQMVPAMSNAQKRELGRVLKQQKRNNTVMTLRTTMNTLAASEINPMVLDALLGWLDSLDATGLFSYHEYPDLSSAIRPGKLLIINLASIISLWHKQIVTFYFLDRIFSLRREKMIPPIISFIEEAHQFAPEVNSAPSKKIIETIAREGRKFLHSLVLISQRPVNLSTTALSQCNSQLILKILNPHDLAYIGKTSEGITAETLKLLTSLGVGEGLLTGSAVNYPVFLQIRKRLSTSSYNEISLASESMRFEKLTQEL